MWKYNVLMLAFLFIFNLLLSKPGDMDSTFGKNGSVTYKLPGLYQYSIKRARIDKDGKIILAGSAGNGYLGFLLLKINDNGIIDSSFGTNGYVFTKLDHRYEMFFDLQLHNNGKIIAAGYADRRNNNGFNADFALARYFQDGRLDSSFGNNGYTFTDFDNYHDFGTSVVILIDNKIIVSGYSGYDPKYNFVMARYMADGSLDSSFGMEGKVKTDLMGYNDLSESMIVQQDGKIVLGGYSIINNIARFALARYNINGTLDSTFGINGVVITAVKNYDVGVSLAYLNTNKLLMSGYTRTDNYQQIALVKYNLNGSIDSSFSNDGFSVNHIGKGDDYSYDMAIQNDGKILVCGSSSDGDMINMILARYNTNGLLDSTFGIGGRVITNTIYKSDKPFTADYAESIVLENNGSILIAGYTLYVQGESMPVSDYYICLKRFMTEFSVGVVDDISDNNNIFIYPNPISNEAAIKFELTKDEYIDIELYDLSGNLIEYQAKSLFMEKGTHSYKIHLENKIAPGEYFINISANNQNKLIKIIKQ